MFDNGKISERGKRILTWIVAVGTFLCVLAICVRSCSRNIQCDFNASRNRVVIQFNEKRTDGLKDKKNERFRKEDSDRSR